MSHFLQVNMELVPRSNSIALFYVLGLVFVLCLYVIAIILQDQPFKNLLLASFKTFSIRSFLKSNFPLYSTSGWLLFIANITATFLVVCRILDEKYGGLNSGESIIILGVVLIVLFFWVIILLLLSWLSGEYKRLVALIEIQFTAIHLLGVGAVILMSLWLVYKIDTSIVLAGFVGVILLVNGLRVIRSIIFSLGTGVKWYYIILYFCTLEIIPLLVFSGLISWVLEDITLI